MRRTHYRSNRSRVENGNLVVESFPTDEIVPHVSKRIVLELKSYSSYATRWGHYYASVTIKIEESQTVVIDLEHALSKALIKAQPGAWDGYRHGDYVSRFVDKQQAIDTTTKWFNKTFPAGSGWTLVIYEWIDVLHDRYGTVKDKAGRLLCDMRTTT